VNWSVVTRCGLSGNVSRSSPETTSQPVGSPTLPYGSQPLRVCPSNSSRHPAARSASVSVFGSPVIAIVGEATADDDMFGDDVVAVGESVAFGLRVSQNPPPANTVMPTIAAPINVPVLLLFLFAAPATAAPASRLRTVSEPGEFPRVRSDCECTPDGGFTFGDEPESLVCFKKLSSELSSSASTASCDRFALVATGAPARHACKSCSTSAIVWYRSAGFFATIFRKTASTAALSRASFAPAGCTANIAASDGIGCSRCDISFSISESPV